MIEAGTVGAVFSIRDDASGTLQRLADEFNRIQEVIDRIKGSIESIGGSDSGLGKLQEQLRATGSSGADAAQIITEAFGKVDGAVDSTIGRVQSAAREFGECGSQVRRTQAWRRRRKEYWRPRRGPPLAQSEHGAACRATCHLWRRCLDFRLNSCCWRLGGQQGFRARWRSRHTAKVIARSSRTERF